MAGDNNRIIIADLTKRDELAKLVCDVPQVNGVVHCACIGYRKPAKSLTETDIETVLKSNFNSAVLLHAALLSQKR